MIITADHSGPDEWYDGIIAPARVDRVFEKMSEFSKASDEGNICSAEKGRDTVVESVPFTAVKQLWDNGSADKISCGFDAEGRNEVTLEKNGASIIGSETLHGMDYEVAPFDLGDVKVGTYFNGEGSRLMKLQSIGKVNIDAPLLERIDAAMQRPAPRRSSTSMPAKPAKPAKPASRQPRS